MKRRFTHVFAASLTVILANALVACSTTQEEKTYTDADYGLSPDDDRWKSVIESYYSSILLDPDSAKFEFFKPPVRGYFQNTRGIFAPAQEKRLGWVACLTVNARNRMGGYTGRKYFMVRMLGNFVMEDREVTDFENPVAATQCRPA